MVIKTINKIEELAIANNYLPKFKCLLAIHLPTIHLILLHAISYHFIFFYSPSNLDYLQFSIIRSCFLGTVPFFFREYFKIRCDLVIVLYNFYYYYFLIVKQPFLFYVFLPHDNVSFEGDTTPLPQLTIYLMIH